MFLKGRLVSATTLYHALLSLFVKPLLRWLVAVVVGYHMFSMFSHSLDSLWWPVGIFRTGRLVSASTVFHSFLLVKSLVLGLIDG